VFEGEAHIVGNEQVEMAIAIAVEKTATCAPARLLIPQAGGFGHVCERAIAIVSVETVLAIVGAKNIFEAVRCCSPLRILLMPIQLPEGLPSL
jgi:hypothetical protein